MDQPPQIVKTARGRYRLSTRLFLARPIGEIFAFFSDAANLQTLTPPWVGFHILTPRPLAMKAGAVIDYRIRIHGLPIGWRTRVTEWDSPHGFADVQERGPYKLWHHRHTFSEVEGGTLVGDDVEYAPRGGALIHALFVRKDVRRIFEYRARKLRGVFSA